ncbi:MAG: hypothetical protein GX802_04110 [Clostridiales bacterium]|nr:hypothetical protein [Clostridiales bacterium]
MYKNIGKIIQIMAIVFLILGVAASAVYGIKKISEGIEVREPYNKYLERKDYHDKYTKKAEREVFLQAKEKSNEIITIGIVAIALGCLVFWVLSCFIYGFGELIVKADLIEKNTRGQISENPPTVEEKTEEPLAAEQG